MMKIVIQKELQRRFGHKVPVNTKPPALEMPHQSLEGLALEHVRDVNGKLLGLVGKMLNLPIHHTLSDEDLLKLQQILKVPSDLNTDLRVVIKGEDLNELMLSDDYIVGMLYDIKVATKTGE